LEYLISGETASSGNGLPGFTIIIICAKISATPNVITIINNDYINRITQEPVSSRKTVKIITVIFNNTMVRSQPQIPVLVLSNIRDAVIL
jgi:hypothetical protein